MNLEALIYKRLSESEGLKKCLTSFCNRPAVFSPNAPNDNQEGWGKNMPHYPRIEYVFDLQANEERNSNGTLVISLLCQNAEETKLESIEKEVRKCLKDVLLKPDGSSPYCFTWARTDAFDLKDKNDNLIIGSEIRFDILEYPSQETTDPDPIMAANQYMKKLYPNSIVVGYDKMKDITEATAEQPVIYCRLNSIEKAQELNTVIWMDGKIAVHILCCDADVRLKMATAIVNQMSIDGEIIMLDYSPMFIKRLQVNYKSDYLREGQIFTTVKYGLLRYKAKSYVLNNTKVNYS